MMANRVTFLIDRRALLSKARLHSYTGVGVTIRWPLQFFYVQVKFHASLHNPWGLATSFFYIVSFAYVYLTSSALRGGKKLANAERNFTRPRFSRIAGGLFQKD